MQHLAGVGKDDGRRQVPLPRLSFLREALVEIADDGCCRHMMLLLLILLSQYVRRLLVARPLAQRNIPKPAADVRHFHYGSKNAVSTGATTLASTSCSCPSRIWCLAFGIASASASAVARLKGIISSLA